MKRPEAAAVPASRDLRDSDSDLDLSDGSAKSDAKRQGEQPGATALLGRAVATIDRLWNETRNDPRDRLGRELGAASRDIHRALMALGDPQARR